MNEQRKQIKEVAHDLLNLAPPPESIEEVTKSVSLRAFIENAGWNYAALDIVDRRKLESLSIEEFWWYIGDSQISLEEPGHLSPVTVAKIVAHGVTLVGTFIEGSKSNPSLFCGEDFPGRVID